MHQKLTTKLIWGSVVVSSLVTLLTTIVLSGGIYLLSERGYRSMLLSGAVNVVSDYLTIENGKIYQKQLPGKEPLSVVLRGNDLSAIIIDREDKILARYGVERDIEANEVKVDKVEQGVYRDIAIDNYGIFDTYTIPLRADGVTYGWLRLMRKNTEVAIIREAIKMVVLVVVPLSWLIAGVFAWVIGKSITKPLTSLVEYLEKIKSEEFERSIHDSPKMDHEVWVVSLALNKLLLRLKESLNRQKQITENISHEFKTPLTRIASDLAVGKVREASEEVMTLGGNVDALLTLAISEKTDDRCEVVTTIRHLCKLVPAKIKVELDLPKKMIIHVPMNIANVVWRNILDNAIKHNIVNGYIKIEGKITPKGWSLVVTNPIREHRANLQKITVRKYKFGDKSGYGIGMSIVEQICKLYNLELNLDESDGEMHVKISSKTI